ncbi:MAG: fused MFS/spermidine synthase [Chloroflexota bacterium]
MNRLLLLVFMGGFVILGMELSASRLLEPAFGNNQIVWAALIGLILAYLAIGGWVGGILGDRFPTLEGLQWTALVAALGVALIPFVSGPVLRMAAVGIDNFAVGLLVGSLVAVLLLFSIPGILLGAISPWAVRLAVEDLAETGRTAGRLYATATVGSILGTFFPVLWFIPSYGTRWSFTILALLLLLVIILTGLGKRPMWFALIAAVLVLGGALWSDSYQSIRIGWDDGKSGEIIYEDESQYNYIAVRQWRSERHLKLNDGVGIHSVYHPETVLSLGIWDYFLMAPYFNKPPQPGQSSDTSSQSGTIQQSDSLLPQNVLLIGLAAGTVSELITNLYGPIPITGIELDPQIIKVGQQYFGMTQDNLTPIAADGRAWLTQQPTSSTWDLIAVDAYRPPYIPFHLTTLEFFEVVHSHLSDNGLLAINIGRTSENFELVDQLATTVGEHFPSIYLIDEPGPSDNLGNTMLVATVQETELANLAVNVANIPDSVPSEWHEFANRALGQARIAAPPADLRPFTDDHAPVERVVHRIIFSFMLGN